MNLSKDDFIKKKFQDDNVIPDKVNRVFEDFKKNICNVSNEETVKTAAIFNEETIKTVKLSNEEIIKNEVKATKNNQSNQAKNIQQTANVVSFFSYKNINKFLSVAAVFLCVVLVGMGTLVKNRPTNIENINIVTTKTAIIKNEELKFSNEEILKISENKLIKASLLGNKKVAIQLKEDFIKLYNLNLSPEKQYQVTNISKNVKNIFVGCMVSEEYPYVLLIMEDGTAECVQILNGINIPSNKYEFNFYSQGKIQGLYNVVAFSQGSKFYYNSNEKYYYINAIRDDGKKKIIELGYFNDWDDTVDDVYNMLNENYIKKFNNSKKEEIDNNKSENKVDGNDVELNKGEVNDNKTNNNKIENENNIVEEESNQVDIKDENVDNEHNDESENIKENVSINTSITNYDNEIVSEFERRVKESNDYYQEPLTGHYCLMKNGNTKSAYSIQDGQLFRYNIEQDNISWIASGVNDLYKDENGNLICKLQESYSINEEDFNIIYQEYNVTNSNVSAVYENEIVKIEEKEDKSVTILIKEGGLEKLQIYDYETAIKENIRYNLYGKNQGVDTGKGYKIADAQIGILGVVGKSEKLNYAYVKSNNTVVCIDIKQAIYNNTFEGVECLTVSSALPVNGFSIGVDENIDIFTADESEIYYVLYYRVEENGAYKEIKFNKDYN